MPVIFFAHGSPMNAISQNRFTESWSALGAALPRPKAIVMISAHWYVPGTKVTAMDRPPTIHDFGGFPPRLQQFEYPAPGDPALAERIRKLSGAAPDLDWGLDHGTWSVLTHVFPNADVPVVELSLDQTKSPQEHYDLARTLAPLRDENILIAANGNIVHNLRAYFAGGGSEPHDWALRFDGYVRKSIEADRHDDLIHYESAGPDAQLSVPTPEHYLPLLYVLALQRQGEKPSFPTDGFDGSSISMLSVRYGEVRR